MTEGLILFLRGIALGLALWTAGLTYTGIVAMWRGSLSISDKGNAAAFFFALSTIIGQVFFLAWPQPLVLVLALMLVCVSHGLTIRVRLLTSHYGKQDVQRAIDRFGEVLPILDLYDLDPETADKHNQLIRAAIARSVANGGR